MKPMILIVSLLCLAACDPVTPGAGLTCQDYFDNPALYPREISAPANVVQDMFVFNPADANQICAMDNCDYAPATPTCANCGPVLYLVCDPGSNQHGYCPSPAAKAIYNPDGPLADCG